MTPPLYILRPQIKRLPIVVSCPHSGTELPAELAAAMDPEVVRQLADTDWFVHELYRFTAAMGITLVHARYSRYVIDLNRDPQGRALYQDQRRETALVPQRTFGGESIYRATPPDAAAIQRRLDVYYAPYHAQIGRLLSELREESRHVLLFDAHSIKRCVPSIRSEPFPDMILGNLKGKTADPALSEVALAALRQGDRFQVAANEPFMGGYLTRHFGQPASGVHALQLEMAQDIYMDEAAAQRVAAKEERVRSQLKPMFEALLGVLRRLPRL